MILSTTPDYTEGAMWIDGSGKVVVIKNGSPIVLGPSETEHESFISVSNIWLDSMISWDNGKLTTEDLTLLYKLVRLIKSPDPISNDAIGQLRAELAIDNIKGENND